MACVLITGASRGIGLELCKLYLQKGDDVYAVCRKPTAELQSTKATIIANVDVTEQASMIRLQQALSNKTVDLLINNAGIFANNHLGEIDYTDIQRQLNVNAIAPLMVTEALLPNLREGAKVALITSRMGSISDNTSGAYYGYRMSKAALNAAGVSLAQDLRPKGIAVALLHPGFVKTQMVGFAGDISPEVAAQRLAERIDSLDLTNTGGFWHSNGDRLPW